MAVHVGGVYVVGGKSNKKGDIIVIYKYRFYMYGYWFYYTIKGNHKNEKGFFAEDSQFEEDLVSYGCDYPTNLKGNEEEDNMDEKIVVLRNDKAVTATKYMDGKKVNSATAKYHPDDKFDFNVGAKIAVGRLVGENNNTDEKTVDKTLGDAKEEVKQNRTVYSNDFDWDKFLNGEVTVQISKEDSVYFFWQFCFAKFTSYFSGVEKKFYDFKDYNPFMNFVFTLNKNDSIWCKMKDGKLIFCKAYGLSPIIPLYKYNGKKI